MKTLILLLLSCLPLQASQAETIDANAMLAAHNTWRDKVGSGKLHYSQQLAQSAQDWANELQKHHACNMQHSQPDGKYGENLYWASALRWSSGKREVTQVTPGMVVASWAGERADYDHASNSCKTGKVCGHYTQLVWKDTREVGCAMAVCDDSKNQVWVCRYQPAGNWVGQKPY